ncbi:MAG: tetratricopeptide repeat protein [Anaerolineales bacterium]|nr:tetratricopeptide repeat protein [Anaerolineales bacterium]
MSAESHSEQRFENMVTILIATVAIWVAITAYFQNYASNVSDQARRRAQQYAIDATKTEVVGNIQYSYDFQGAFQIWKELDWQIVAAQQNGDANAAQRYQAIQEKIKSLSPLLQEPYFGENNPSPNTSKYQAETYFVESTRLSEIYFAESDLGNFTDNIADSLVVQITLLTVSLSLYGLSMALKGKVRWLFIFIGSGIVGFCFLWAGWSSLIWLIRPTVNQEAIRLYSEGAGLAYQGLDKEAIEKYSEAIQKNKYYAKAYYQRGLSYFNLDDLPNAIADIEKARDSKMEGLRDTVSADWNLGWLYYLSGQYEDAVKTNLRTLKEKPYILGMQMNLGLVYLARGDFDNAQKTYDFVLAEAQRQVNDARLNGTQPPANIWYYLDAGALDLQNLIDQIDGAPKAQNQAPEEILLIGDRAAMRGLAAAQIKRVKEASVALEYTSLLPSTQEFITVSPFTFGSAAEKDAQGFVSNFAPLSNNTLPYGENAFSVRFAYSGVAPKQIVWKVYYNGYEDRSLRVVSRDDISGGTTWYQTFGFNYTDVFILSPGEYTVELYADNILVQSGTFSVK